MSKKIAVILGDRQSEAMRMALGLTLVDDKVDLFWLDARLDASTEALQNLELMKDMGIGLYSNSKEEQATEYLSREDLAHRLLEYDHILAY
jgi:hypothetical protein